MLLAHRERLVHSSRGIGRGFRSLLRTLTALSTCLALAPAAHATDRPALNLHVEAGLLQSCSTFDPASSECEDIRVSSQAGGVKHVTVIASGVESLAGVQFGILYPPTVEVLSWTSCASASIPSPDWPQSRSAMAVAWDTPVTPTNADRLVVVGYLTVIAAEGALALVPDDRVGRALYVDRNDVPTTFAFDPTALGIVTFGPVGVGYNPCGQAAIDPEEILVVTLTVAPTPSFRTNVLQCGTFEPPISLPLWTDDVALGQPLGDDTPHTMRLISDGVGADEPVTFALHMDEATKKTQAAMVRHRTTGIRRYAELFTTSSDPDVPSNLYLPQRHFMEVDGNTNTIYYVAEDVGTPQTLVIAALDSRNPLNAIWRTPYSNAVVNGDNFVGGIALRDGALFVGGYAASSTRSAPFALRLDAQTGAIDAEFTYPFAQHDIKVVDAALDPRPGGEFWMAGLDGDVTDPPTGVARIALDSTTLTLTTGSSRFYAPNATFFPEVIELGPSGTVAIAGVLSELAHAQHDLFVLTSHDGSSASHLTRYQDGWADVQAHEMAVGSAGDVYLLGGVLPVPDPPLVLERAILRVDPDGAIAWDSRLTCPSDKLRGGTVAIRDGAVLVGVGMFAPGSGTLCEDRACVNLLGLRRDTGELYWHGLDVQASGLREPVLAVPGPGGPSGFRTYTGGVYARAPYTGDGLTTSAFLVPAPPVVDVGETAVALRAVTSFRARQVGDVLRVFIDGRSHGATSIGVFDVAGREIDRVRLAAGSREAESGPLASGVYFLRALESGAGPPVRAVMLR